MEKIKYPKISDAVRERHKNARLKKSLYEKYVTEENIKYKDFMKRDNPLDSQIVSYEVSFQSSYQGGKGAIYISPFTFIVFGLRGSESEIEERTINMVLTSTGKTGNSFSAQPQRAIESGSSVTLRPRGLEQSEKRADNLSYENILMNGFVVKQLDGDIKVSNHKNYKTTMKLDITHFL